MYIVLVWLTRGLRRHPKDLHLYVGRGILSDISDDAHSRHRGTQWRSARAPAATC